MKSRGTTYLLLAVVIAIWGLVAWKILRPAPDTTPRADSTRQVSERKADEDTLRCDYPDPFLKNGIRRVETKPIIRALPPSDRPIRREQVRIEHLGTVRTSAATCYILSLNGEQYELHPHEQAGDFTLVSADRDSVYLEKQGVRYGVERCE